MFQFIIFTIGNPPPPNYHFTMENSNLEGSCDTVKNIIGLGGGGKAAVTYKFLSNSSKLIILPDAQIIKTLNL